MAGCEIATGELMRQPLNLSCSEVCKRALCKYEQTTTSTSLSVWSEQTDCYDYHNPEHEVE